MKKFLLFVTVIVLALSVSVPVYAKTNTCGKSGCDREKTSNGTI